MIDMSNPLVYILSPFALAFILFVIYLVVSIIIRDPARPFRMFAAGPLDGGKQEARQIIRRLESEVLEDIEKEELLGRLEYLADKGRQDLFWREVLEKASSLRSPTPPDSH